MQQRGMITDGIRVLLGAIDTAVYWVLEVAFQILFDLAGTEILTDTTITNFTNRIYLIIGVFMLFKLTFSLFNSVVNPDSLLDKEKGVGKIITRIMISMIMLIMVPTGFALAKEAQTLLIPIIPRLIIGKDMGSSGQTNSDVNTKIGRQIAFETYRVFFTYDKTCYENTPEGDYTIGGYDNDKNKVPGGFNTVSGALNHINDKCTTPGNGAVYKYDYMPIVPLLAGGFLAFILIGFCVDVAMRVFKLAILQLFAPIPIISYIDPKSEKSGAFSEWVKNCVTTYLSLFITLGIVYFVIFIVNEFLVNGIFKEDLISKFGGGFEGALRAGLVIVFLIIGLFFFAKKAPKFVMDILGVKSTNDGFMGKMAKTAWNKTGGTALGTAGGALGGAYAGLRTGGVVGAKSGAAMGSRMGFKAGWDGKGKAFSSAGDKVLQTAIGDSSAKMGVLGGPRFVDKMSGSTIAKSKKDEIIVASDKVNARKLEKLDNKYMDKYLIEEEQINSSSLSQEDKLIAKEQNYEKFQTAINSPKYKAKRNDIASISDNRKKSEEFDKQTKMLTKALADAKIGGGDKPVAGPSDNKK